MRSVFKLTFRSIRSSFGRFMAVLLIVALSVGLFAGLKITKDTMVNTCDKYLCEQNFYDFRLISTLGITEDDVESFGELSGISAAEGAYSLDMMLRHKDNDRPMKVMSLPKAINVPTLTAGRLPEKPNECLADDERFYPEDIGSTVSVSEENDDSVTKQVESTEYTIVGLVDSPMYIGIDRGSTGIGGGAVYAYIYIPEENFTSDVYTEAFLTFDKSAAIYSPEYDALIDEKESAVTDLLEDTAKDRYDELLAGMGLTPELGEQYGVFEPETYVLTRDENAGYVSFENDTSIVSGIANIFPIFFILISILVCMTTMSRMVDEERTQIGTLKAMGFGGGRIMAKYLLYAGVATVLGWGVGFFLCTWGLPEIFWIAYNALYNFSPLTYLFSAELAVLTLSVSVAGILGSTFFSCRKELGGVPAALIRPRAAKSGKRILLERFTLLWKRFTFLQKITLRNMFRYKKRMIMMLVGISCCAGLVVTGFGVRDSMMHIGTTQFSEIQMYDMEISFDEGCEDDLCAALDEMDEIGGYVTAATKRVDVSDEKTMNSVGLMCFGDGDDLSDFWRFEDFENDGAVAYPEKGEAIVTPRIAEKLELEVGDTVSIKDTKMNTYTVKVSGVFENFIYNYIVISEETYADAFGEYRTNTALILANGYPENVAEMLTDIPEITSVEQFSVTDELIGEAMASLDYIILMVVLFSGALAFIVTFNLTNINLAERSREIATVQVLGFYPRETESYVLRENLVLSVIASFIGLPLGWLFHNAVMNMIYIDSFAFDIHIKPMSYVLAVVCTVIFALVVNLVMKRQIGKIKMAESLKEVE